MPKFASCFILLIGLLWVVPESIAQKKSRAKRRHLSTEQSLRAPLTVLERAAKRHRFKNADQLKQALQRDKSLRLNLSDDAQEEPELLFVEPVHSERTLSAGGALLPANPTASQIPDSQVFFLHSKSGAKGTLYLNFKGKRIDSRFWNDGNPFQTAPFNMDTAPEFSAAELAKIKEIWLGVTDDYSPFDLDVTTEPPQSPVLSQFLEIVITPTSSWLGQAGGVCIINGYTSSDPEKKECFVFSNELSNSSMAIAEATSHEAGHGFGLYHWARFDSSGTMTASYYTGNSVWAPIMGVAYSAAHSSWSRGEYPNSGTTAGYQAVQDDVAIIKSKIAQERSDEAGGGISASAPLVGTASGAGGVSVKVAGVISSQSDVDVYHFDVTTGGIDLTIQPATFRPNLDAQVRILNSSGAEILKVNPDRVASAIARVSSVSPGRYFLEIMASGFGDPMSGGYSVHGAIGQYAISGAYNGIVATPTPTPIPTPTPLPTPTPTPSPVMTPTPTPTPTATPSGCVRTRWDQTRCGGVVRNILKVTVQ